jgi:hypothetical protein
MSIEYSDTNRSVRNLERAVWSAVWSYPVYCAAPASGGLGRLLPLMSVAG